MSKPAPYPDFSEPMSCCVPARDSTSVEAAAAVAIEPAPAQGDTPDIAWFRGGPSIVGTTRPEIAGDGEGPQRTVRLKPFGLDKRTVSNGRFARFVAATGYRTEAEEYGWSFVFMGLMPPADYYPQVTAGTPWWVKVDGASWAHPEGPETGIEDRLDHPAIHISQRDAAAFAKWAGGRLPTEAEWEHAARSGENDMRFPWGDTEPVDAIADPSEALCNIWQGSFPNKNTGADGWIGTAPVDWGRPNKAGLYNMAGNVWEWTSDPWRVHSLSKAAKQRNAVAARQNEQVLKGGSFLCHKSYCYRYRIAARSALPPDSGASNAGFRVAFDAPREE